MADTILVAGKTFPYRTWLKKLGGRWIPDMQAWELPAGRASEIQKTEGIYILDSEDDVHSDLSVDMEQNARTIRYPSDSEIEGGLYREPQSSAEKFHRNELAKLKARRQQLHDAKMYGNHISQEAAKREHERLTREIEEIDRKIREVE